MLNQRSQLMKTHQPPITSQSINQNEDDTKILSNIDCSNELLHFARPQQPPSYSDQYSKKKSLQKQKEIVPASTSASHNNNKARKKMEEVTDKTGLLISTSQDKILSPKTNYNFLPRSNSQKKVTENNMSQIGNCSEINYTNYHNSNNTTTCVYSSAEGYWQRREMEKKKKLDKIRDMYYQKEQNEMRDRPNISKNSQIIASQLRSKSKEQVFERLTSGVDVRKKNEDIKNIEMKTRENRQPIINQSSQRLQRTIDDLYQWKVQIERKKLENQTVTNCSFDPNPIINGESEHILKERKPDYLRKRVEDRLIEQGEITKIKKEEKKEHYHERIMAPPNDDKKCYMTTCPSKRTVEGTRTQQNQLHSNLNVYSYGKKYIQKNTNNNFHSIQNSDNKYNNDTNANNNNRNNKRSTSGKFRYSNEVSLNHGPLKQQIINTQNNNQSNPCYSNNFPSQNTKPYDSPKTISNSLIQDNVNLSCDISCNPRIQQQQYLPSPSIKTNVKTPSVYNNLVEIRKHLNDYYEQKSQMINKSFSYQTKANNKQKNISKGNVQTNKTMEIIQSQVSKANVAKANNTNNSNNKSNINVNNAKNQMKRPQIDQQSELEEDKIINQIPQNEPQVKYQPISFQEEKPWIPCGKDELLPNQQQANYNNYYSNSQYNDENYLREPKPIDYNNNHPNQYYSNEQNRCNNNQYYQINSSQGNSTSKQSDMNNNDQPMKYNFNHEIFNRFIHHSQDKLIQLPKNEPQSQTQTQPRQCYTLSPGLDSNIPSARYEKAAQFMELNIPSVNQYKDENPLNKYREETNKRLQDLEQMQKFANNLRQSNDIVHGKKIMLNQNNSSSNSNRIPQSQITNAQIVKGNNDCNSNQVNDNMTYLNERLKLNEQSKNFLYEKMNQMSAYPTNTISYSNNNNIKSSNNKNNVNAYYHEVNGNQTANPNNFDFTRQKI